MANTMTDNLPPLPNWLSQPPFRDDVLAYGEACARAALAQAQSLPAGYGGGLVAIKTLLSRDPFAHATTAIAMIDAMLSAAPAAPEKAPNAQQAEPPPWWPAVENILNEYGLQAVDFVADFKAAQQAEAQEPCQSMCETPCTKRKPLTIAEVEAILARWSYELHGDRARFIVRETELAHGIGAAAAMAPEEAR